MLCCMPRNRQRLVLIAVALLLGGCGGMPKKRRRVPAVFGRTSTRRWLDAGFVPKETFEVERPFREVSIDASKKGERMPEGRDPMGHQQGVRRPTPTSLLSSPAPLRRSFMSS